MGIIIALIIVFSWSFNITLLFSFGTDFNLLYILPGIILQTFLYTGLFITSHDAMHGSVSKNIFVNNSIGKITTFLFLGLSYKKLKEKHILHHRFPGTDKDPDYFISSVFIWWIRFLIRYFSLKQLLIIAVIYNLLKIIVPELNIWLFWILPAVLSSFQLFYWGTYQPHRLPHTEQMRPHNSRTQNKNHIKAFFTCYFFGYHYEHHQTPGQPWWLLYKMK